MKAYFVTLDGYFDETIKFEELSFDDPKYGEFYFSKPKTDDLEEGHLVLEVEITKAELVTLEKTMKSLGSKPTNTKTKSSAGVKKLKRKKVVK